MVNENCNLSNCYIGKDGFVFIKKRDSLFYSQDGKKLKYLFNKFNYKDRIIGNNKTEIYAFSDDRNGSSLYTRSLKFGKKFIPVADFEEHFPHWMNIEELIEMINYSQFNNRIYFTGFNKTVVSVENLQF